MLYLRTIHPTPSSRHMTPESIAFDSANGAASVPRSQWEGLNQLCA